MCIKTDLDGIGKIVFVISFESRDIHQCIYFLIRDTISNKKLQCVLENDVEWPPNIDDVISNATDVVLHDVMSNVTRTTNVTDSILNGSSLKRTANDAVVNITVTLNSAETAWFEYTVEQMTFFQPDEVSTIER